MDCDIGAYIRVNGTARTEDLPVSTPDDDDDKVLILSDAPEVFPQENDRTILPLLIGEQGEEVPTEPPDPPDYTTYSLYKCEVPLTTSAKTFRVFIWHVSRLSDDAYLQLIASSDDDTSVTLSGFRLEQGTGIAATGKCTSIAMLYDDIDSATPENTSLNGTEKQIWNASIGKNGGFRGAVLEFTLTAAAACTIRIRTAVNTSTSIPGSWSDDPAWPWQEKSAGGYVIHSRGWWPHTTIKMPAGSLDLKPVLGQPPSIEKTMYPASGTVPELAVPEGFGKQSSGDEHGTTPGNKGCWGAELRYEVALSNTGGEKFGAKVWMVCREMGLPYYGSVRIELPTEYPVKYLNNIDSSTSAKEAEISVDASNSSLPIYLDHNEEKTLRISVVHAGGASLPVNFVVQGGLAFEETGGPG